MEDDRPSPCVTVVSFRLLFAGAAADAGHVVRTTPEFLTQLNERLEKERPAFRIQESSLALDNDFQLLMNDATHLAGEG